MSMLDGEWAKAVGAEFKKPYYRDLYNFVRDEYATHVVYPPADDIFNAMHFTPLDKVKVLILGQDPYHNVNQAHGLSFSVLPSQKDIPPSLQNIYKELHDDLGCDIPNNGYLKKWADQGVLLLNTVLTVRAHQANSHQGHGWERFTDAIIRRLRPLPPGRPQYPPKRLRQRRPRPHRPRKPPLPPPRRLLPSRRKRNPPKRRPPSLPLRRKLPRS